MSATADLSDVFLARWLAAAGRLQADPFDLLMVSFSESNVRANAHNPNGDASGLIQFMPATLRGLGWTLGDQAFRTLDAADQVPFVEAYFRPWALGAAGAQLLTPAHCYVATFLPGTLRDVVAAGEGWRGVILCQHGGKLGWAYDANKVLDYDKDGAITAGDLADHLDNVCKGARWDELCARMLAARGDKPAPANDVDAPAVIDGGTVHPRVEFEPPEPPEAA